MDSICESHSSSKKVTSYQSNLIQYAVIGMEAYLEQQQFASMWKKSLQHSSQVLSRRQRGIGRPMPSVNVLAKTSKRILVVFQLKFFRIKL